MKNDVICVQPRLSRAARRRDSVLQAINQTPMIPSLAIGHAAACMRCARSALCRARRITGSVLRMGIRRSRLL